MAGNTDYKNKWQAENRERINMVVPKGYKELIKTVAQKTGESVNGYIKRAIDERMERDNSGPASAAPQSPPAKQKAPQSKLPGLPFYLTPDILSHIDAKRFLSSDMGYQLQIAEIIGMGNLSSLAEYLKQNPPEPNNEE